MILVRYDEYDKGLRLYDIAGDLFLGKECDTKRYSRNWIERKPFTIESQSHLDDLNKMLKVKRRYVKRFEAAHHNVQ